MQFFRFLVDFVSDFIYKCIHGVDKNQRGLPVPIKSNLILQPAHVLARMIRDKEVTSVQVVSAFIQRINDVNSTINCVVDNRQNNLYE